MKKIAVYGAGGFGREVACLIEQINAKQPQWQFVGFYDDGHTRGDRIDMGEVLGGICELNAVSEPLAVALAFGNPQTLKAVREKICNPLVSFPNLVDPTCVFLHRDKVEMGEGNIFCAFTFVSLAITIGNFNIFNGHIGLGHDSRIGNYNCLMPAVRISGNVEIGNENFFGMESGVIPGKRIGNGVRVGAGSIIMRNTKDNECYVGNPAKKLEL